jgi:hypothetical protein
MSRQPICTCSYTPVNSATIDPPDLILDPWCPVHGKDPDAEYERQRDDAKWAWYHGDIDGDTDL